MNYKLLKGVYRLDGSRILSAVRRGFVLVIPVVLTGSLALLIRSFPIPQVQVFLEQFAGGILMRFLDTVFDTTIGFLSAYLVLGISYYYSAYYTKDGRMVQVTAMITAMACFIASFGAAGGSLTLDCFGTIGVFTAMLSAIAATRLFFCLYSFLRKHLHAASAGNDSYYRTSLTALLPFLGCVAVFTCANLFLVHVVHVNNFNDFISNGLTELFHNVRSEPANGILYTIMLNLLWVFGIHGGNALDPVGNLMFATSAQTQTIISKSFMDNFAQLGGCGATVCLVLAMLLVSRSRSSRKLAYSSVPLTLFNINEILVFGLPIVLNPILLLPFILVPLCSLLIGYGAVITGFMPAVTNQVVWTTPVFFSGYLATGSMRGALVQLIIIIAGTAIYIPFIRLYEKTRENREQFMIQELVKKFCRDEKLGVSGTYLNRNDSIGIAAKTLADQLQADIARNEVPVYYQPQVNEGEQVIGAEALLRWSYGGKTVYPPLVIALAREAGCLEELTVHIFNSVCRDICIMKEAVGNEMHISANMTSEQLDDTVLVDRIIEMVREYHVEGMFGLEVTEEASLNELEHVTENIDKLRKNNIAMAIDDFSMGQTSLNYLKTNNFRFVKLDGGLVRQAEDNVRCREIISSIAALGVNLDFQVIAEQVETQNVKEILLGLGCRCYQGFLYSRAVPLYSFIEYCREHPEQNR
ncbi:PTS sugar transporter subunit IIC/EAL domain-containing protein [Anaerolentibacter hominis]|uniref:PTS sugar transporter subunit IIC/EAL domain-containing protein n=1 Tax=Anaerolentibacter hominis TaxID=3079009 RepID=UPI0031B86D92